MENLLISIGADTTEFINGLGEVGEKTEDLGDNLKGVGAVAATAFAGYTASIMGAVYAYREEELAGQKIQATIAATGGIAGVTAEQVDELADSFSRTTTFSKLQVEQGEAVLLTFDQIGKQTFPKATQATLDLATGMGTSAASAAEMLGRALQDPMQASTRLTRAGIILTAQQKAQIEAMELAGNMAGAQGVIIAAVEQKYGKMAQAAAGGTGQIAVLKNAMEDMAAKIGSVFAPYVGAAASKLVALVQAASDNEGIMKFVAATLTAGAAVTGAIAALVAGKLAFGQLSGAMEGAQIAMKAMGISFRTLAGATGIGLVLVAAGLLYEYWDKIWPVMQATFQAFVQNIGKAATGLGKVLNGAMTLNMAQIKEGLAQAESAFAAGSKTIGAAFQPKITASPATLESAAKAGNDTQMALNRARILAARAGDAQLRAYQVASQKAANDATMLENQHFSSALVALKKKEGQQLKELSDANFKGDKQALKAALSDTQAQYEAAYANELKAQKKLDDTLLKNNKAFQKMSQSEQQAFLANHQAKLVGSMQSESDAKAAVAAADLEAQIKADNTQLEEQVRFGSAYAAINAAMHNTILTQSESSMNQLSQMTQSKNELLKSIGKAAAAANIIIQTAQGALVAYAGFCNIPIVGPALGIAAAAAVTAYGVEREQQVLAAAQGGLVTGGTPGVDSVSALLTPGELVAPKQNFEEVVQGVNMFRNTQNQQPQQPVQHVVTVQFKGSASQMLTAQVNQDKALGRYRGSS